MSVKLSIIVPVYEVEKYLRQCIDSILNQTFQDFEVILVDDGSKDHSGEICDQYAEENSKIKVIHQVNAGAGKARNAGLDKAIGEYIAFIDGDDWIESDMYEMLFKNLYQYDGDVAICSYVKDYQNKFAYDVSTKDEISLFDAEKAIKAMLEGTPFGGHVWNKIYKNDIFQNLRFSDLRIAEDALFSWQIFNCSKIITYNISAKYHYRQRANSACNISFNLEKIEEIEARKRIYEKTVNFYPNLKDLAYSRYMQCVIQIGMHLASKKIYKEEFFNLREILRENSICIRQNKLLKNRFKKHLFFLTMPYAVCQKFYFIRMFNRNITDYLISKFRSL